mgnify:CR=1 FL=1
MLFRSVNELNIPYYQNYESIVEEIVTNVIHEFQYNRFDENGPKYGPVTKEYPICFRYFSEVETKNGVIPMANNGWIHNEPTEDFIAEGKEYYLRRKVVIWDDNVKLRYGKKKKDNPYLWKYMKKYVCSVAKISKGFRLDNTHSTPINVCNYLDRKSVV